MNKELISKFAKLKRFFDIERIVNSEIDQEYVSKYYITNKIPYSLFHTKEHFVHMGITKSDKYTEDDLYAHVKEINELIKSTQ